MNRVLCLLSLLALAPARAQAPSSPAAPTTIRVPREKIVLSCAENYAGTPRVNFLLTDETYGRCVLRLPLDLRGRWPGAQTYFVVPRVSASLYAKDSRGKGRWLPLSPLTAPGGDPLHGALDAQSYCTVALEGALGRLKDAAGDLTPDTVSAGGKLTVCAAPVTPGTDPCATFDITARYKVYLR